MTAETDLFEAVKVNLEATDRAVNLGELEPLFQAALDRK
jgi:hypothetical protein